VRNRASDWKLATNTLKVSCVLKVEEYDKVGMNERQETVKVQKLIMFNVNRAKIDKLNKLTIE
jgi:hypothetical protein